MKRLLCIFEPILLAAVPIILFLCAIFQIAHTAILTVMTVILSMIPFFLRFEKQHPRPRDIMPIVVLSAIAAVGRMIFAPFPDFKPVTAIVILSGVCFGRQSGFLTGALAALASNMFFGQGPWTPWQMYCWGLIGYLAGVFVKIGFFEKRFFVYLFGILSTMLYGLIIDTWYLVGFVSPITWQTAVSAYLAGLPFNITHAVATVVFLIPIFSPWRKKINRIQKKYGIIGL